MPNPVQPPTQPVKNRPWIALLAIVVAIGAAAGGWFMYTSLHSTAQSNTNSATTNQTNTATITNLNVANTNIGNENTNLNTNTSTTSNTFGKVGWHAPTKVAAVTVLKIDPTEDCISNDATTLYSVGSVTTGKYAGGTVEILKVDPQCPENTAFIRMIKTSTGYTVLKSDSDNLGSTVTYASNVKVDSTSGLPGITYPATLSGPTSDITLTQDSSIRAFFDTTGLTVAFTDPTYGPVYMRPGTATLKADAIFSTYNGFYLKAADGTVRVYSYLPNFITVRSNDNAGSGLANITWTADMYGNTSVQSKKNTDSYAYTAFGGCGATNYINVVDVDVKKDMHQIGTTNQGDPVYTWTDTNSARLKEFYSSTSFVDSTTTGQQTQKVYTDYLDYYPLIYWVDPFGRTIELSNSHFSPLAECGKPVIYLYPTKTTQVHVDLKPAGGFTTTEPAYGQGWNVIARANGQLTNLADGKTYPYLFWEGRGGLYSAPSRGFVVSQAQVHTFLTSSLTKLGLNQQERSGFMAFWEPRLLGSPYYRISFFGNQMMNQLAPLTVTPTPQTVIRVLMDYEPLSQPINIAPQTLSAPARTGFTVIEWGGVLR